MKKLLIASTNRGKLVEMSEILAGLGAELVLLSDYGIRLEVAETGSTYAENAAIKARAYFEASQAVEPGGLVTVADDSGLEVDALGGAPGLYSARYSPLPGAKDADRRAHLLKNLAGVPHEGEGWDARFCASAAVVGPGAELKTFDGSVAGLVIDEERGAGGFGYDPVFYMPAYGGTMAELGPEVKNQISHRARALQAARGYLEELLRE